MTAPDQPSPLALTRHERIQAIVAMDVLLAVARITIKRELVVRWADDIDASIREVETLRAKIREGLK